MNVLLTFPTEAGIMRLHARASAPGLSCAVSNVTGATNIIYLTVSQVLVFFGSIWFYLVLFGVVWS
jgi:hypothetical protein